MNSAAYNEAFAKYAPIMRARWIGKPAASLAYAKSDILAALHAQSGIDGNDAYVGKLYAELDAVRDAEHAAARAAARRK
jgi:hypothetical protein